MARWQDFRKCPGCGLDIATGEGERSCAWGDCPYLPEELDVYCDTCRFNFFTGEGNPSCEDPITCEHAAEPLRHLENVRTWISRTTARRGTGSADVLAAPDEGRSSPESRVVRPPGADPIASHCGE